MKYKIELTKQADVDLRGIYEYIALNLLELETAARLLERIEKGILSLDEMPEHFEFLIKNHGLIEGLDRCQEIAWNQSFFKKEYHFFVSQKRKKMNF